MQQMTMLPHNCFICILQDDNLQASGKLFGKRTYANYGDFAQSNCSVFRLQVRTTFPLALKKLCETRTHKEIQQLRKFIYFHRLQYVDELTFYNGHWVAQANRALFHVINALPQDVSACDCFNYDYTSSLSSYLLIYSVLYHKWYFFDCRYADVKLWNGYHPLLVLNTNVFNNGKITSEQWRDLIKILFAQRNMLQDQALLLSQADRQWRKLHRSHLIDAYYGYHHWHAKKLRHTSLNLLKTYYQQTSQIGL